MDNCTSEIAQSTHPVYRYTQLYNFVVATSAIYPLYHFITRSLTKNVFKDNLKLLLNIYFVIFFVLTIQFSLISAYNLFNPFLLSEPCDILVPRGLYHPAHVLIFSSFTIPMFFPLTISIVSVLETRNAYICQKNVMGPILGAFAILTDLIIVALIYYGESFDVNAISIIMAPSSVAPKSNVFLTFLFGFNVFNFLSLFVLLKFNNGAVKNLYVVSQKYEIERIISSTRFVISVLTCQTFFYGIYLTFALVNRHFKDVLFPSEQVFQSFRGTPIACVITNNLAVSFVGRFSLRKQVTERNSRVQNALQMRHTGVEGIKNYNEAVMNAWHEPVRF